MLMSEPWIAYGQQRGPSNAAVDNPPTNSNGVIGEVSLPYTVPVGKKLILTSLGS
jgi:hypothetical protein